MIETKQTLLLYLLMILPDKILQGMIRRLLTL